MEPAIVNSETESPPGALKQIQFCGVNANGELVFRRGPRTKPPLTADLMKEGNENGKELSQTDIDRKMMPPPEPRTSPPSPTVATASVRPADQLASDSPPEKRCRLSSDELSENSEDHDAGCLFMVWVTRRQSLMTDEEVRSAFVENVSMIKNKTRRDLALKRVPEALEPDGHVMEYLKSQREYYDSLKQQFADQCECYEECSDSND